MQDDNEYESATLDFFTFLLRVIVAVVLLAASIVWLLWMALR